MINHNAAETFVTRTWQDSITGELIGYIRIPNKSRQYRMVPSKSPVANAR